MGTPQGCFGADDKEHTCRRCRAAHGAAQVRRLRGGHAGGKLRPFSSSGLLSSCLLSDLSPTSKPASILRCKQSRVSTDTVPVFVFQKWFVHRMADVAPCRTIGYPWATSRTRPARSPKVGQEGGPRGGDFCGCSEFSTPNLAPNQGEMSSGPGIASSFPRRRGQPHGLVALRDCSG